MFHVINELLKYYLSDWLGNEGLLGGLVFFIAFWFVDSCIMEFIDRRFGYAIALGAVAIALCGFLAALDWSGALLLRGLLFGAFMYAPLFAWMRKTRRKLVDSER